MMFSMVVSLFTTRVVLDTLGASDYGIYNLVGGVVGLMGMVTSLLSQGTSRFVTIALGKNNLDELKTITMLPFPLIRQLHLLDYIYHSR